VRFKSQVLTPSASQQSVPLRSEKHSQFENKALTPFKRLLFDERVASKVDLSTKPLPHSLATASGYEAPISTLSLSLDLGELREDPRSCQERWRRLHSCSASVAAPRPILAGPSHLGPDWIQDDVPRQLKKMSILLDKDRLVAPLKKMARPRVASVGCLCVDPVQVPHPCRQRRIHGLDQQMYSVATHRVAWANYVRLSVQAVGVAQPVESLNGLRKDLEESAPICIVNEDPLSRIASRSDVIQSPPDSKSDNELQGNSQATDRTGQ